MEITWLGHSCFRLKGASATVITDPYPPTLGISMGEPEAPLVTVSNGHPNHGHCEGVKGEPIVVRGPGEYEVSGVYVRGIRTTAKNGQPNTAFLIDLDGLTLCHLGDLPEPLSARQIELLGVIHVLFLPVGGGCTLSVPQAVESMRLLEPRVVIPMHYRVEGVTVELGPLEAFLKETGLKEIKPQVRLSLTQASLPQETAVMVLERATA